jgi:hypothetical protein
MGRAAHALVVAGIAVAGLAGAPAANAETPDMVCPDMFVPILAGIAPPGTDKNGNFIVCAKPADGMIVWRDDLIKTPE